VKLRFDFRLTKLRGIVEFLSESEPSSVSF